MSDIEKTMDEIDVLFQKAKAIPAISSMMFRGDDFMNLWNSWLKLKTQIVKLGRK